MGFKFSERKNTVKVEIEGKSYPIAITEELGKRLVSVESSIPKNCKSIAETVGCIDGLIDKILGSGKAAEIFSGREADVFERLDVLDYICRELTAAVNKYRHV